MNDTPQKRTRPLYDAEAAKTAANGRWVEILSAAGIPEESLDGRGYPCPKCGTGDNRFAAFPDVAQRGAVHCRHCFAKGKGGDGIATVAWIRDCSQGVAIKWIAEFLGMGKPNGDTIGGHTIGWNDTIGGGGKSSNGQKRIVATYDYCDESGKLLFQVVRYEPKDFRQRKPDGNSGWDWSVKGIRQVPYNLPAISANPARIIVVAEGERDVDGLAHIEILGTCNAGGACKWTAEHAKCLGGCKVVVTTDNDEPGRKHGQQVAESLQGIAEWVKVIELPNLPPKGDVSDWIAAGGTKEQLKQLISNTKDWSPDEVKPEPWPELEPLDSRDLPTFPIGALPSVLRDWVEAESHATQTPPDLAALLSLAVCGSTIARRVEVVPRRGWHEPTNLYTAILLGPANRKSAVFTNAIRPLRECEEELAERERPAIAAEQSERRQAQKRLEKLERRAADKDGDKDKAEARELAMRLADWPEPALSQLIVDDATSEALTIILARQGGRVASLSPEGGVFDLMAGLYSKSGIPQFGVYLMGHSGDTLRVNRVGRQAEHIERPALTCAYAIQPQVIEGLAENAAFRGRGLLARFLYAFPRSPIGEREIAPSPVPASVSESYGRLVRHLAEHTPEGELTLTRDAQQTLIAWETAVEEMLADGGELEAIRDWGGKLVGATARLAAVIHCVDHPGGNLESCPIAGPTVTQAIEIARYLIPHAEAVLRMMTCTESTADADALFVLRWIKRYELREFTKRDAHRHGGRRFPAANDIDPVLTELVRRGYIRLVPQIDPKPGRPPSPRYEVRTDVLKTETQKSVDTIDNTRPESSENGSSVSCVNEFQGSENKNGDGSLADWGEV